MTRARSQARRTPRRHAPQDQYFSKIVGKALGALDLVRASPEPVSLNALTVQLGLAKTSVFRILHTLEVAGYVEREPNGCYRTPAGLRPLASGSTQQALIDAARRRMKDLNGELRETVSLAMRFENHIEVIATLESPHLIRMGNTVGRIIPPHASSLGKAIAAFQPEDRRDSLVHSYGLHRFTPHTIVDERELKQELERVRSNGFSIDAEESALGGICFGAPVRGGDGHAVGALSVSMPKMRLSAEEHQQAIVTGIVRAANAIGKAVTAR